ncbi:sodium-dependent transporter [Domibacillus sp. PGB-M46]|uniref:sodium-dependent transporter n=1 Tax=Domibacillus sp. PGB-M46 TaxID=2910255 RepID=UPI001F55F9E1|nr:sodium-dependent transporter [Domibacillus sp. PGB-M46]MCI2253770.1 sodium-dependent transporter [Domibacillus sp. PGB-M46]
MEKQEQWSSKIGFILSSAGAAIGLGAIWKFPYVTGQSGGGAFLLLFVIFTLLIGLPMLVSEFIIGRGSGREAVGAYKKLAPDSFWTLTGKIGVVGCFLLLSFYSVVGGWVLIYTIRALYGGVIGSGDPGAMFGAMTQNGWLTIGGHALFILLNIIVIAAGVQKGIEFASKYMMPLLFIFFIILVIRSLTLNGAMEGVAFFLQPDFSKINAEAVLYALGHSFFSLAVGFSCMVTYSSYLGKDVSIPSSAGSVAIMNIFVSVLAGLAIFPAVFAFGLEPTAGPGLLFVVLPAVFSQMPFGELFLFMFLLLFLFATLTSSFSLLEIITAAFTKGEAASRKKISLISGIIVFLAGIPAALSFSAFADISYFGRNIFDMTDYLVSNILLPLGNLLIALFIAWRMDQAIVKSEYELNAGRFGSTYAYWLPLMRWIVPITIAVVFVYTMSQLKM